MKLLVLLSFALVAGQVFAKEVKFKCEMNQDITYKGQFSLDTVSFDDEAKSFSDLDFNFTFKKAGYNSQSEQVDVTRDGNIVIFPAGTFSQKQVFSLTSAVKGDDIEFIGVNVDLAGAFTSQVRLANGITYFSSCKSL